MEKSAQTEEAADKFPCLLIRFFVHLPGIDMISRLFKEKYRSFALLFLSSLGITVYSNTFVNSFHFDDLPSIVQNPAIRNVFDLRSIWNFWPDRFITYLSLALNYSFHQLRLPGYHIFNLAVHVTAAALVWWIALLTFSTPAMKKEKISQCAGILALFAGGIFLAHPVQTQAVTYIIQRATSLATLFYIASLGMYIRFRLSQQQQKQNQRISRRFYYGSVAAAVMAMFTKGISITIPFTALLYEFCFLRTRTESRKRYPLLLFLTALVIPLTFLLTRSVDFMAMKRVMEIPSDISSGNYLLTQFRVIVTYLRLAIFPVYQNFIYDYPVSRSLFNVPTIASLGFLALILAAAIKAFPKYRPVSFGVFWFFLTLLPESSLIPIRDVIFEHRLYLPMAGISLSMVSMAFYFFKGSRKKAMVITLLIITCGYAVLAYNRNFIWKDELALWNDVVRKSPGRAIAFNSRGDAYLDNGDIGQALADYNKAIEINPLATEAYNNRGNLYKQQGKIHLALADYEKAIEIDPGSAATYNNRGNIYKDQKELHLALADYNKAIELDPALVGVYVNRANIYKSLGDTQKALADYNRAVELHAYRANVYNNRGNIYKSLGDNEKALADYNRAIELNPDHASAYFNRGYIYKEMGKDQQALADYNKAVQLNPDLAQKKLGK